MAHGKTRVHPDSGVDSGVDFGVESENAIIYNTEWASGPEMLLFTMKSGGAGFVRESNPEVVTTLARLPLWRFWTTLLNPL